LQLYKVTKKTLEICTNNEKVGKVARTEPELPAQINLSKMMAYQDEGKCTNAYKLISSKPILLAAYRALRSKPGMMTKGVDHETLDGINMK